MNCPYCGFENESGVRFCRQCGKPQSEAPQYAPPPPPQPAYSQPPYAPPQPTYNQTPYAPPGAPVAARKKKGNTGLIIGICAGVVVIAVVLALVFLLPSGPVVEGYWVSEDEGIVLSMDNDGELTMYSLAGAVDGDYDFDKADGTGSLDAGDVTYEFTVDKDQLKLTNTDTDDKVNLSRADEEPDIEEIVTASLIGLWTNDSNGEVLEFKSGGEAGSNSPDGEFEASFEFDIDSGEGTFLVLENEYAFTSDGQSMTLEGIGPYQKVADNFDIATFVSEHSNPLPGVWYDQSGVYGTIEFLEDGTCSLVIYGISSGGTYTYDSTAGTGELSSEFGDMGTFTYSNGTFVLDGVTYTQDYVSQQTTPDYTALTGEWYESTTGGSVSFYDDGTFYLYIGDTSYYGSFTFDPVGLTGTITTDTDETLSFYIASDALYLEEVMFTRNSAGTYSGVEGYWYDLSGEVGTIYFYSDLSVELYSYGIYVYGTYTYDASTGTGTLSLEYEGEAYESSFSTSDSLMVVEDVTYTRDYVEQPVY